MERLYAINNSDRVPVYPAVCEDIIAVGCLCSLPEFLLKKLWRDHRQMPFNG